MRVKSPIEEQPEMAPMSESDAKNLKYIIGNTGDDAPERGWVKKKYPELRHYQGAATPGGRLG